MFTEKDIRILDQRYFRIVSASGYGITLQSKNTRHYWYIMKQDYDFFSSCIIYHSHHGRTNYHRHGHAPDLQKAIDSIVSHDIFQLNGRKKITSKTPVSHGHRKHCHHSPDSVSHGQEP